MTRASAVSAAGVACVLAAMVLSACGTAAGTQETPRAGKPDRRPVPVELVFSADRVHWRPARGGVSGTLSFSGVAPKMAVMTQAPRRHVAVVPAHFLASTWRPIFRSHQGVTNAVLSFDAGEDSRRLVSLAVRFVRASDSASRFEFRAEHLERGDAAMLGTRSATFSSATLLVDPLITAAIKNLWAILWAEISQKTYSVGKDPTTISSSGDFTYDKGTRFRGPDRTVYRTVEAWQRLQKQIFDAAGPWKNNNLLSSVGEPSFTGTSYSGLALIPGPRGSGFRSESGVGVRFDPPAGQRVRVVNASINLVTTPILSFNHADVGGTSLRGARIGSFQVRNSAFDTVDWSGARISGGTVSNSVFGGIRTKIDRAGGDPKDPINALGSQVEMRNVDFTSTSFQDASFIGGSFDGVTFQGCGLQGVDFTNAKISGPDRGGGAYTFSPTFKNSILEKVTFDGATLQNVSFAGVDFSNGGVSFAGATLSNVDFTGAIGLQDVDFSGVNIEGDIYGLAPLRREFEPDAFGANDQYLRSVTDNDRAPDKDAQTGFDVDQNGRLVVPETGVRLERDANGRLRPFDPATGRIMVDPDDPRQQLSWEPTRNGTGIFNPADQREVFRVDYATGRLER
jgi:uncharacterized protein YjbI with pentapeptide repeats